MLFHASKRSYPTSPWNDSPIFCACCPPFHLSLILLLCLRWASHVLSLSLRSLCWVFKLFKLFVYSCLSVFCSFCHLHPLTFIFLPCILYFSSSTYLSDPTLLSFSVWINLSLIFLPCNYCLVCLALFPQSRCQPSGFSHFPLSFLWHVRSCDLIPLRITDFNFLLHVSDLIFCFFWMWCLLEFLFQASEFFPCLPLAVLKCAQPMSTFTFPAFSCIVSHAVHPSAQHLAICTCFLWSIGFNLYWYSFLTSSLINPFPPIFSFSFICGRRSSLHLFLWFLSIDLVLWILFGGSPGLFAPAAPKDRCVCVCVWVCLSLGWQAHAVLVWDGRVNAAQFFHQGLRTFQVWNISFLFTVRTIEPMKAQHVENSFELDVLLRWNSVSLFSSCRFRPQIPRGHSIPELHPKMHLQNCNTDKCNKEIDILRFRLGFLVMMSFGFGSLFGRLPGCVQGFRGLCNNKPEK